MQKTTHLSMEELYVEASSELGNLILQDICQQEQNRFKYYTTHTKHKIDGQILSGASYQINYHFKPETIVQDKISEYHYLAKANKWVFEMKTVNYHIQPGKERSINNRTFIEIYKRNNLIQLAKEKQARPIFINIYLDGTVLFFDAITCSTDLDNYLRQANHQTFSDLTTDSLAYKFHAEEASLKLKLPYNLKEYHQKIKLFMIERTGDIRFDKLDLFKKKNNR